VYPAVLLMYFISAAVILLASFTLIVSLPYNKTGRISLPRVMKHYSPTGSVITAELSRDFWIRETVMKQVAQLHERYRMMMMVMTKMTFNCKRYEMHGI
jgi:hypothetical protein